LTVAPLTFTPGTFEIVGLGGRTGFDNTRPNSWRVAIGTSVSIGSHNRRSA
jgi:hypothetical protein